MGLKCSSIGRVANVTIFNSSSHIPFSAVQVHAGYVHVSIIHRTLTWPTGSLMCVYGLSYACVYTRGLGTPTTSQHNLFDLENLKCFFLVLLTGFEPSTFGSPVQHEPTRHSPVTYHFNHWAVVFSIHIFVDADLCCGPGQQHLVGQGQLWKKVLNSAQDYSKERKCVQSKTKKRDCRHYFVSDFEKK